MGAIQGDSFFAGGVASRTPGRRRPPRAGRETPIAAAPRRWEGCGMYYTDAIGWGAAEAERAFGKAVRARRRASLLRRVLHRCGECARLVTYDAHGVGRSGTRRGVRDIPLDAITGSLEPNRAAHFDSEFRPSPPTRSRWLGVWLAEQRGAVLPPISVAPIGDAYAIRDGHHRVSVARARGAVTITAIVA
jgi:hypothetical protein